MPSLMAADCVRTADPVLIPPGTRSIVVGAASVAEETTLFAERIRSSTAILVNGRLAYVIAPGGHPLAVVDIATRNERVTRIDIARTSADTAFTLLSPTS